MNADTDTLTDTETWVDTETALPDAETKEEVDLHKLPKRTPPKEGICRRCGENKPVNRLMLCYPCWVKTELEKSGWREGMPHPDWCHCEGVKEHVRRADGN
ncbi:MAG: hypothetical protein WC881_10535 [Elusimicrobiota bacterium]|jgi:hypothetical protein